MHSSRAVVYVVGAAAYLTTVSCGDPPSSDALAYNLAGRNVTASGAGVGMTVAGSGAAGSGTIAGAAAPPPRNNPTSGAGVAAVGGAGTLGGTATAGAATGAAAPSAGSSGVGGQSDAGALAAAAGAAGMQLPVAGGGAPSGTGPCCPDGDCLCHGPDPSELTDAAGPYKTAQYQIATGTVVYPTDAEPPFAALALCGGFLNTGPEMAAWGPLYASHGIVMVITATDGADVPDIRAMKLLASIEELKSENTKSGGPLNGKLSGRYGTSGYSMGGGGTTLASAEDGTLRTSLGLAPWGGDGSRVKVPTLLLCGDADTVAPCNMAEGVYAGIADPTPKMLINVSGATHFNWFGPSDAGRGTSGKYALAFQKVFLEGDERWRPLLLEKPSAASQMTNIQ